MAKRFKLRICKAITTTLQSCRSKDTSNLPQDPVPSLSRLITHNQNRNHKQITNGNVAGSEAFRWQKEDKWHVVAKIYDHHHHRTVQQPRRKLYNSSEDDLNFAQPVPPTPSAARKKRRCKKKKRTNIPSRLRGSTSSTESGWFSSEAEETETLVSSTITTGSSSPHAHLHPIGETRPFTTPPNQRISNKRRTSVLSKRVLMQQATADDLEVVPARLSVFKRLIPCTVEGKVKESFAIVKRSKDPYEDFKSSMVDMILEKQMFDPKDLEQLLQCFLSLNSRSYHEVIVRAFTEIWEAIFMSKPAGAAASAADNDHHVQRPRVSRRASF